MKKEKLSTWKEIQKKYPDEWVLITDVVTDKAMQIKKGLVVAHTKTREEAHKLSMNSSYNIDTCRFTGDLLPKNFICML
jgi:hypothetical protein